MVGHPIYLIRIVEAQQLAVPSLQEPNGRLVDRTVGKMLMDFLWDAKTIGRP
jgi:hypothetical protein